MKKQFLKLLSVLFTSICLIGSTTAFASTNKSIDSKKFITKEVLNVGGTKNQGIVPYSGTGYSDAYLNASDYTRILLNGVRMNDIQIVVSILQGHFYSDIAGNNTVHLDRADSMWTNNGRNCDILSTGSLYISNNTNFSQNVQVRGLGSTYTYSQSLTKSEALNIVNSGSCSVSIPGFGSLSASSDVERAYSYSSTRTCSISVSRNFSQWYNVKTNVTGFGSIYTSCSM